MNANKSDTGNVWIDPDDAPELTREWFESAEIREGGRLIRRGRPVGSGKKESATIRFDAEILRAFRMTGKGWQTRMNDALKDWLEKHPLT